MMVNFYKNNLFVIDKFDSNYKNKDLNRFNYRLAKHY